MVSKTDISRLTGLTGVEVDNVIRFLEKKNVDWQQVPDWATIGEDIADFGDKYDAIWDKLVEHGIVSGRPLPETRYGEEIKRKEEEEIEWMLSTKDGFKELLDRIYKDKLSKKQKEKLKEEMLNYPELATEIALYDGEEQGYAKRYLAEMIVAPTREDIKDLLKADIIKIRSKRGWVKSINDVVVKPIRSVDLVKELLEKDFKLVTGERENGTVAIYSRKKPVVEEIVPKKEVAVPKIEELATQYSYAEVLEKAQEHKIPSGPKVKMLTELLEKQVL